ncbi:DUF4129 domain-containing protein [Ornithinimicrobium sp. F0845]|uniref:DUF4129 domain-containing protein n=1 Tax=Ornithinimicrobium sp. F0845 TaxID=2926412 RepID=UPI001FF2A989|nr:DUF4129 domain-containing protein [Ornithinimicrobium sp. F0845]MCK0111551.1 DUF4129 domain-containing protein [Ornithinimicrobium sp. F0845]
MHRGKVIAAAAVAAVVLILLTWGSGSGTSVLSPPSGEVGIDTPTQEAPQNDDVQITTTAPELPVEGTAPALDWLMVFFALVILAIAVKFLQWLLRRDWDRDEPPVDELDDDLGLLLTATSEEARRAALAEGEPRNVVVRCWVALEDAASASGLARDPAETAAEFTRRFLGVWDVDEASTQELAELYREARFSRHPVAQATGDRAVTLVGSIHDQLAATKARAAAEDTRTPAAEDATTTTDGGHP